MCRSKIIGTADVNSVHIMHSHSNVTPPSPTDFQQLLKEQIDKMTVIAYNGDTYSVSVGSGIVPTKDELNKAIKRADGNARTNINDMSEYLSWTEDERNYMVIREQAYLIAREFKWLFEGGNIL